MAIGYINMSASGKSSPVDMEQYMERKGKYTKCRNGKVREDLVATGSGNLPKWAKDAEDFWKAEDDYRKAVARKAEDDRARREEKSDGKEIKQREIVRCRRVIIALPGELDHDQQKELLESYLKENFSQNAYTWAIHDTRGRLSGERNPHAHVLVCQKKIDPQKPEPSRDRYFSRRSGYHADKSLSGADRRRHLEVLKKNWERAANRALEKARKPERVKMGKTPGITPSFHLGERAVIAAIREYVDGCVPKENRNRAFDAWRKIQEKNISERYKFNLAQKRKALCAEQNWIEETKNPSRQGIKGWLSKWGFFEKWREEKMKEYEGAYDSLKTKASLYNRDLNEFTSHPERVVGAEKYDFECRIESSLRLSGIEIRAKTHIEKVWDAKSPEEKQAEIKRVQEEISRRVAEREAAMEKMLEENRRREREMKEREEREERKQKEERERQSERAKNLNQNKEPKQEKTKTKTKTRTNGRNRDGWDMGR